MDDLDSTVDAIIDDILDLEPETLTLSSLASTDAYTLEHSIDVTILGLLVANRLFREHGPIDWAGQRTHSGITEALRRFGIGLLLHDVGEFGLPAEITRKTGALDDAEREVAREHTQIGLSLLDEAQISSHAVAVVRWHHEKFDGSGYPDGLRGPEIPQFERIAAVAVAVAVAVAMADAYSELTTRRWPAPSARWWRRTARGCESRATRRAPRLSRTTSICSTTSGWHSQPDAARYSSSSLRATEFMQ